MTDTRRIRLTERLILEVMDRCGPRRDELVVGLVGLQGLRPRQLGRLRGGDVDLRGERLVLVRPDADDVLPRRAGDVDEVDLHPHLTRVLRGYLRHDRNAPRGAADALLP
ncbi:hypothetical protein, partial [Deinococcus pimensis]|uniref:hypothetical protein n=1 Tax=Deinococcus pimensis TaxID=309888 RepID=UPI0005EBBA75